MRARMAVVGLVLLSVACATPRPLAPVPDAEDYVYPAPAGLAERDQQRFEKAWRAVMAGDTARAEKELRKLASSSGASAPLQTALGYAQLRGGGADAALVAFQAALALDDEYVPALIGAAGAQRRIGRIEEALASYTRARELAPDQPAPALHIPELRLQVTDRRVARAQEALAAGQRDEAITHYQVALQAAPEVSGVRLELANLLARRGDVTPAVSLLRGDPGRDPALEMRAADLLAESGDAAGALEAYQALLARDPSSAAARAGAARMSQQIDFARMPVEYREIFGSPRISRADLAALVSMRVSALAGLRADAPPVAIDISGSWARDHILRALSYGLFDLFPNHTFQPGAAVRRGDVAIVLQRILDRAGTPQSSAPPVTDVHHTNSLHYPVARVVGAGLMSLSPAGAFEPWRPVSGEEAVMAIDALARRLGR